MPEQDLYESDERSPSSYQIAEHNTRSADEPNGEHDIIVIGASAGGVEAVKLLVSQLPADLRAAVFIVIHFPPTSVSLLPGILSRGSLLPVGPVVDGEAIRPGRIYVAQTDAHLLVQRGVARVYRGPKENHTRPAIDPLFRSAARAYGPRVVGVLLSGMLTDGTAGLVEVKAQGGLAVVQSPDDAMFPDMPRNAIKNVDVDYVAPLARIAAILVALTAVESTPSNDTPEPQPQPQTAQEETLMAHESPYDDHASAVVNHTTFAQLQGERNEQPSIYSCPDCGGVLWQMNERDFVRFRCHVGHAYSAESLLQQQAEQLEGSMWYAVRTLIDKSKLSRQLAERARERGHGMTALRFEEQAQTAVQHADVIRRIIESGVTDKFPIALEAEVAELSRPEIGPASSADA